VDQPQQRERLARLLADVRPHDVEPGELGEYAEVRFGHGDAAAELAFPGVAAHLRTGCRSCEAELRDFSRVAALWQPDATPAPEPELPWLRVVAGRWSVRGAPRRRSGDAACWPPSRRWR
jgi:hypothetical protein